MRKIRPNTGMDRFEKGQLLLAPILSVVSRQCRDLAITKRSKTEDARSQRADDGPPHSIVPTERDDRGLYTLAPAALLDARKPEIGHQ